MKGFTQMPSENLPLIARITANGQPLPLSPGNSVVKFVYEDCEKKDDLLKVTFTDPFYKLVDSEACIENTLWVVQFGFAGKLHPARKVYVKRPKFTDKEFEVECLDKGADLKVEERWHAKGKTTVKEILGEIANRNNLKLVLDDPGLRIESFPYGGMTDFEVIKYLESKCEDHFAKVSSDQLLFQKRKLNVPPVASFAYQPGQDSRLLGWDIKTKEQDTAKSSNQTSVVSMDPYKYKREIYKSDEGSTPTENLGNRRTMDTLVLGFSTGISNSQTSGGKASSSAQGQTTGKSLPMPPNDKKILEGTAKGKRRDALLDSCEAKFDIVADPSDPYLGSGDIIQVVGIGKKYSGNYQIVSIKHDLSEGYKYEIEARRNAVNSTSSKPGKGLNGPDNAKGGPQKFAQVLKSKIKNASGGGQ